MSPDRFEDIDRRTFVKGAAATGVAATGVGAFSGSAAAQDFNVNANQLFGSGLIVVQGVNVTDVIDVGDVTVNILEDGEVQVGPINVQNVNVLNNNVVRLEDILSQITVDLENVLNENVVQVNVLSGGAIGTDTVRVPQGLL